MSPSHGGADRNKSSERFQPPTHVALSRGRGSKPPRPFFRTMIAGRPLTGARIETTTDGSCSQAAASPSHGGADRNHKQLPHMRSTSMVALSRGRGSKLASLRHPRAHRRVALSRGRGSKLALRRLRLAHRSRPLTGARIETVPCSESPPCGEGRPLTGARIETRRLRAGLSRLAVALSRGRGSKPVNADDVAPPFRRPLTGARIETWAPPRRRWCGRSPSHGGADRNYGNSMAFSGNPVALSRGRGSKQMEARNA